MDLMWGVGNKEQRETEKIRMHKSKFWKYAPHCRGGGFSGHRRRGELGIGGRK